MGNNYKIYIHVWDLPLNAHYYTLHVLIFTKVIAVLHKESFMCQGPMHMSDNLNTCIHNTCTTDKTLKWISKISQF